MRTVREAALALLVDHPDTLSGKAAQFCGQISVSENPLTEKQTAWLSSLLQRAGLPPLADGGDL